MRSSDVFRATKVISGFGVLNRVGTEAAFLGGTKVLIIADEQIACSEAMDTVKKSLWESDVEYVIQKNMRTAPTDEDCVSSSEQARKINAHAIIGFGGNSLMNRCKAAAVLVTNGGTCRDWDGIPLKENMLPVICIPTTAGTGSEVNFTASITDTERKLKIRMFDPEKLIPNVAIIDPSLALALPPIQTALTGIDALARAIEAYNYVTSQQIVDSVALHAIELISQNLKPAMEDNDNLSAKEGIMVGNIMAGIALSKSDVGGVHAISETLEAWYDISQALCSSILLPYVMEYYLTVSIERLAVIAEKMGICPKGKTRKTVALEGIQYIRDLSAFAEVPELNSFDCIKEEDFKEIAETSARSIFHSSNAGGIGSDDYLAILKAAFEGNEKNGWSL